MRGERAGFLFLLLHPPAASSVHARTRALKVCSFLSALSCGGRVSPGRAASTPGCFSMASPARLAPVLLLTRTSVRALILLLY